MGFVASGRSSSYFFSICEFPDEKNVFEEREAKGFACFTPCLFVGNVPCREERYTRLLVPRGIFRQVRLIHTHKPRGQPRFTLGETRVVGFTIVFPLHQADFVTLQQRHRTTPSYIALL